MKFVTRFILLFALFSLSISAQENALTLDDCINIALESNSTLRINRSLNQMAEEDVLGSYNGILPTLTLSASSGRFEAGKATDLRDVPIGFDSTGQAIIRRIEITQPGFTVNFNNLDLSLNQNLFDGGEWWNRIKYRKSQMMVSELNLKKVTFDVVLSVQESYYDLLKQQKLLEVYELAVQRSRDQLDKTQKMYELGSVAKVDVFRSKVNLGNDRIQLLTQKNAVLNSKNQLNLAMGREPGTPISIKPDLDLKPAYSNIESLIDNALHRNPALLKDQQTIESEDINVSRAYSSLYPNVGAFARYSRSNEQLSRVYGTFDKNWSFSFGLSLSVNLFNGFQDKVNIQKQKLQLKNTRETYESNRRSLISNITQLADNYNAYLDIIEINEENLEAAKEEYRLAEERYRIGSGTALEVREAQVNLTRAEQTLVAAQYNARITQAQLEHKLGTIYQLASGE